MGVPPPPPPGGTYSVLTYFCYLHEAQSSPRRAEIETEMRRAGDTVSVLQGRSVERGGNMRSKRKPFKDL